VTAVFAAGEERTVNNRQGNEVEFDVPDGIIAHLTRECGRKVHGHKAVEATSGSFEKRTCAANSQSGAHDEDPEYAPKSVADLKAVLCFLSPYRSDSARTPHRRSNWVGCDFKERRIVPTRSAICTNVGDPGSSHLKSWLVEGSVDGENWGQVGRQEDSQQPHGNLLTATFSVAMDS
jgi:hypothetical protein